MKVKYQGDRPVTVKGPRFLRDFQPGETADVPDAIAEDLKRSGESDKRKGRKPDWLVSTPKPQPKKKD